GPASSIYNTSRQVASSFGVALLATVQVNRYHSHLSATLASAHISVGAATRAMTDHAQELAYHDAFFVAALLMTFS
ncbi:MAG: hypothetical protein ACHQ7M_07490, partial [Chloroflexota bacterium]